MTNKVKLTKEWETHFSKNHKITFWNRWQSTGSNKDASHSDLIFGEEKKKKKIYKKCLMTSHCHRISFISKKTCNTVKIGASLKSDHWVIKLKLQVSIKKWKIFENYSPSVRVVLPNLKLRFSFQFFQNNCVYDIWTSVTLFVSWQQKYYFYFYFYFGFCFCFVITLVNDNNSSELLIKTKYNQKYILIKTGKEN